MAVETAQNVARRVLVAGEPGYPLLLATALRDGHITEAEHDNLAASHARRWRQEVAA